MTRFAGPGDEDLLRSIVLDPSVRAGAECDGAPEFDPTKYTQHPKSRAVLVDGGCWLMAALEQDAYGIHTCLLPEARGGVGLHLSAQALEFAFVHTDAMQLWTMVPANNPQALRFAHWAGFRDEYTRKAAWQQSGVRHAATYLRMDVDRWVQTSARMQLKGDEFHQRRDHVSHAYDPMHDRYVGAAWEWIRAGQFEKAHHVYNRWARMAGYQPFEFVSMDPLAIDIGDARVALVGDELVFEECHA